MNGIKPVLKNNKISLIELMITVAVMGIIVAIGYPIYTDYIETARVGALRSNIESIRLLEEDFKLSTGSYVAGTYDPADPDNAAGLKEVLGWQPRTASDNITYVIILSSNGFTVTATDDDGHSLAVPFP